MNKLSRKDIELLEMLAKTQGSKDALGEYIKQHEKAVKAYKIYRESVVAEVEVEKVVKPVETKRKFKAGDKVRVISVEEDVATMTGLSVGDVTEVIAYKSDSPKDWGIIIRRPVIVTGGHGHRGYFEESALELVEEKSPNELRAEIIQRAKEFVVKESKGGLIPIDSPARIVYASFAVNAKKRTVVAFLEGVLTGKVYSKGIAKCHPNDVFNKHIGKAIALGRALGKDVSEFENAVQPTEPVIGHKLSNQYFADIDEITSFVGDRMCVNRKLEYWLKETLKTGVTKIIDDTHAIYKEEAE